MSRTSLIVWAALAATAVPQMAAVAQHDHRPTLHVDSRWKECAFQLSASLTQDAWRQFTREAALVAYFRPLVDARPLGRGHFEVALLQWETRIDDHSPAWNDTFVHPDSTHWLFEGAGLSFPGLAARVGVADRTDVGVYFTKNANSNYGFYGVQLQQGIPMGFAPGWDAAARASYAALFGPDDLGLSVVGLDLLASRRIPVSRRIAVSPYGGVSTYLSSSHEKSPVVQLRDERVLGAQAMVGAEAEISVARVAIEYNVSRVNSLSVKVGLAR